jgi:putative chitinase
MLTLEQLHRICPHSPAARLAVFIEPLNAAFEEFEINTRVRQAAFLAQAAHECMGFQAMREFGSGEQYSGRKDLGNDQPHEGQTFKGRGIFQLTGDANYVRAGTELYTDPEWFRMSPELAAEPVNACRIAGWYWKRNGLNELADRGDFRSITKRINGGYNGLADREDYFARALKALP